MAQDDVIESPSEELCRRERNKANKWMRTDQAQKQYYRKKQRRSSEDVSQQL